MVNRLIILVFVAALSCIITRVYYVNKHEAFIQKLNAETSAKETELQGTINDLLDESYTRLIEIEKLSSDNAALVRKLGGLRDPGNISGSKNKSSSSDTKAAAGTVLSREATEFLLNLTREADEVREQLRLCQKWAESVSRP